MRFMATNMGQGQHKLNLALFKGEFPEWVLNKINLALFNAISLSYHVVMNVVKTPEDE